MTPLSSRDSAGEYAPTSEAPASSLSNSAANAPLSRRRVFWLGLMIVICLVPIFISLGLWQWNKAETKARLQTERDTNSQSGAISLSAGPVDPDTLRFRQLSLLGEFDASHQVLIDNQLHHEQAGYHVITPMRLANSDWIVLVNRGWIPAGPQHTAIPEVAVPDGTLSLTGIAVLPGTRFFNLQAQPKSGWSPVWQNLDLERFKSIFGEHLHPLIIQLDPAAPAGFVREWPRPDERIERHRSYALQWFGFAIASLAIWLFLLFRRP